MDKLKVYYDRTGNTLTVWFGDPQEEHVSEETGDEVILMKDKSGRVIGFEKLNYSLPTSEHLKFAFRDCGDVTTGAPKTSSTKMWISPWGVP